MIKTIIGTILGILTIVDIVIGVWAVIEYGKVCRTLTINKNN